MKEELEKKKKLIQLKNARKKSGIDAARSIGKATNERDAQLEKQTSKRYEKVGVSPIYSKGTFTTNSKEQNEKYGNRLTEDDKATLKNKKKK